jgi:hypothetical protein
MRIVFLLKFVTSNVTMELVNQTQTDVMESLIVPTDLTKCRVDQLSAIEIR